LQDETPERSCTSAKNSHINSWSPEEITERRKYAASKHLYDLRQHPNVANINTSSELFLDFSQATRAAGDSAGAMPDEMEQLSCRHASACR
jgi:hypothetical protein